MENTSNNICDKYAIYSDAFDAITTPCRTESESVINVRLIYILGFSGSSEIILSYLIFLVGRNTCYIQGCSNYESKEDINIIEALSGAWRQMLVLIYTSNL